MKVSTAKYRNSNLLVPIQIERKSQCVTRGMKVSTEKPTLPKSSKSRNSNLLVPIQIERKSQYRLVPPDTEVWNTRSICSDHTFETSEILTNSLYKSQRTGRNFFLCAAFCAAFCADFCAFFLMGTAALLGLLDWFEVDLGFTCVTPDRSALMAHKSARRKKF